MDADAALRGAVTDAAAPSGAALLLAVALAAGALAVAAALLYGDVSVDWGAFAFLAVGAVAFTRAPPSAAGGWSFRPTGVFLVAGTLLLPPALAAGVAACAFAPAVVRERRAGRRPLFEAVTALTAVLLAGIAATELAPVDDALAATAACVIYVGVNDALVALMYRVTERRTPAQVGLLDRSALVTAFGLAALGVVVATAWESEPWLVVFALAPLGLVYQALTLPGVVEESALDPKTKLYNARRFAQALAELSSRAARERAPLAVLMADLDFLRDVNNTYGHLAGDVVLSGVADVIRANIRVDDVAARFGGEEFAVLLPDTGPQTALEVAERIRAAVERTAFRVDTSIQPVRITISVGVACYPRDAGEAQALLHAADVGLYEAKGRGRNRVCYPGIAA